MNRSAYRAQDYAFGQRILALRTAIGLTQAGLADLLGVSRRAIVGWEAGESYPKPDHLQQLIRLCVEHRVFRAGSEAEEIRDLWHAAHQKALLNEQWLHVLLAQPAVSLPPTPMAQPQHSATSPAYSENAPHNLPSMLTPCVGRTSEIALITGYLAGSDRRLISLVGIGGVGKTRLALEVAWTVLGNRSGGWFRDGVYVVALADVDVPTEDSANGADIFATAIADALGFALSGVDRPYQQVLRYLDDQHMLLVLDNLEHMLHLTPTIVHLLEQTPLLTILVTSTTRLDVRGEQVVSVDALATATASEASPALELFQRTALLHAPHLRWSPDEVAAAAAICRRVEGMPLAIELAASLVRLLSLQELATELDASSAVLQTSRRDLSRRHHSLRAVFDHSWRLLRADEQHALAGLSVFRGGFNRHAARAVANADLATLAALLNHSLLREAAPGDSTARYNLHALVREYAAEMLHAGDPKAPTRMADQHSHYYLEWVAARLPDLRNQHQQAVQVEIYREIDNIRAAWRWAVAHSNISALAEAGGALFHFYWMRSSFQEGAELFQLAATRCEPLAALGDRTAIRALAKLRARQGWLTFHLGQPEMAHALLAQSLALLDQDEASEDRVFTLNYLASVTYHSGHYADGERLAQAALATSEQIGDQHGAVIAKTILGQIAYLTGAYSEARRRSLESLELQQTLGNRWGTVFPLISLGRVAMALEAYDDARRWFEEGLAIREMMGDPRGVGLCLTYLGDVASALGEHAEAKRRYQASLSRFRQIHNSAGVATSLTKLGAIALATQDQTQAQQLLDEALRTAWGINALPETLQALVVLAASVADDEPTRAAELAALVVQHRASTQVSRHQATLILERLASQQHGSPAISDAQEALVTMMSRLLAPPRR